MKKMYSVLSPIAVVVAAMLCLIGCSSKEEGPRTLTPDEINKHFASGVVLIKNTYYYTIDFGDDVKMYFTGFDKDGDLDGFTLDPEEIVPVTAFGTGFFVSQEGLIATNSHVAQPSVDSYAARSQVLNAFSIVAESAQDEVNTLNEKLGAMRYLIASMSGYEYNYSDAVNQYSEMQKERDSYQKFVNVSQQLGSASYRVTCTSHISVAFSNTFVTNNSDFKECVLINDDAPHDLALVQLKDKQTPAKCHVFNVAKEEEKDEEGFFSQMFSDSEATDSIGKAGSTDTVSIGKTLYIIGYNLGPSLALTQTGVLPQVTKGDVSQNTDDMKLMYTVPALHGSSGAPVVDAQGRLVAVNFAGISTTQSFNYGVRIRHLRKLMQLDK